MGHNSKEWICRVEVRGTVQFRPFHAESIDAARSRLFDHLNKLKLRSEVRLLLSEAEFYDASMGLTYKVDLPKEVVSHGFD